MKSVFSFNIIHFARLFLQPKTARDRRHRFQRIVTIFGRVRWAFLLIAISLLISATGFVMIEHYTPVEAWYMAVITLSTVGFTEVRPLSEVGRVFTSGVILFNVGIFAYAISSIVSLFAEGNFSRIINEFRMYRTIESLSDHTIICGYGRHATELTQELSKQNMPFVVIEKTINKLDSLRESGYLFIEGDATEDDLLTDAGINRAKAIVITLPDDADNLFITLSARQMNPGIRIIARANSPADEAKMRRAGADETVVPERIGGFFMATLVNKPDLVEFFRLLSNMGPSNVVFEEFPMSDLLSQFTGHTIADSGLDRLARVSLVAVRFPNGQYELNPVPETVLSAEWHLVLLGNPEQMKEFKLKALKKDRV